MEQFAIQALPILLAVTLHEVAHGWVARRLGDQTAEAAGRLTLNPIAHVDPVGTVLFPAAQLFFSGHVFFGWAKPVPVNPAAFENPRRGMMWVALGGPAANLALALVAGIGIHMFLLFAPEVTAPDAMETGSLATRVMVPLFLMCVYGIAINIALMAFNLIPLPPLDGSRVAYALLPLEMARQYGKLERYGLLIVFGLIMLLPPGFLWRYVIQPVQSMFLFLIGLG